MSQYKNELEDYLYNHNYISNNKKSNYQQELSIERAECIIYKHDSIMKKEKEKIISFLENEIKEIEEKIKDLNYNEIEYYDEVRIDIYQEVLDFVNKGGK